MLRHRKQTDSVEFTVIGLDGRPKTVDVKRSDGYEIMLHPTADGRDMSVEIRWRR